MPKLTPWISRLSDARRRASSAGVAPSLHASRRCPAEGRACLLLLRRRLPAVLPTRAALRRGAADRPGRRALPSVVPGDRGRRRSGRRAPRGLPPSAATLGRGHLALHRSAAWPNSGTRPGPGFAALATARARGRTLAAAPPPHRRSGPAGQAPGRHSAHGVLLFGTGRRAFGRSHMDPRAATIGCATAAASQRTPTRSLGGRRTRRAAPTARITANERQAILTAPHSARGNLYRNPARLRSWWHARRFRSLPPDRSTSNCLFSTAARTTAAKPSTARFRPVETCFLPVVPVRHDHLRPGPVGGARFNDDACAHGTDLHAVHTPGLPDGLFRQALSTRS